MCHNWKPGSSFLQSLVALDEQLQEATHRQLEGRCPHCQGPLHRGDYPRKPRGIAPELENAFATRFSYCCGRSGCRRRVTPPSVRFLGRKVYVGAVVFIATVWWILDRSLEITARSLGVPARTALRWWHWWTVSVPRSAHWRTERGRFAGDVDLERLPLSLLERFGGETPESRLRCGLLFMAPATTESASFVRVVAATQKLAFA